MKFDEFSKLILDSVVANPHLWTRARFNFYRLNRILIYEDGSIFLCSKKLHHTPYGLARNSITCEAYRRLNENTLRTRQTEAERMMDELSEHLKP